MQEVRHGNFEKYHCATTKKSKHDPSIRCQVDPSIASYLSSRATFLMTPFFSRERPWYAMIPREPSHTYDKLSGRPVHSLVAPRGAFRPKQT